MTAIPFSPSTSPGIPITVAGGGRLINAYAEVLVGTPSKPFALRRAPGLGRFSDSLQSGYRGSFFDADQLFTAWNGNLVWTDSAGVSTTIGVNALPGADFVTFCRNNLTPTPQYFVNCASGLYNFTAAGVVGPLATPAAGVSCDYGEGYVFLAIGDGRVYASDLNANTFNTLNRMVAESSPDGLVRAVYYNGELWCAGSRSIEVWGSGGDANPTGFPLRRTTVIKCGLATLAGITGMEYGFGGALCAIADDDTIKTFQGYTPVTISDPWLTHEIGEVNDKSLLELGSFSQNGRQCIFINGPTFSAVYDFSTKQWHERKSYLEIPWRWRAGSCKAFNEWMSGDAIDGSICRVHERYRDECGQPLIWRVESGPVEDYPIRQQVGRASFEMQQGTGLISGAVSDVDPQMEISWSDDGGSSWVQPLLRPIGRIGEYRNMVEATQLGLTGYVGRRWRLSCASAVDIALLGGEQAQEARR